MSGSYDYNQQGYGSHQSYGQAPPPPQYGHPQAGYQNQWNQQGGQGNAPYGQPAGYGAPPAPQYASQSGGYSGGPPDAGGFNQGQAQPSYGQPYSHQQQQYASQHPPTTNDPSNPYGYTRDPADPNHPQEGERGFMGAVAGGVGGGLLGHKAGHGIIGTLAGAFLGSKAEDKFKQGKHSKPHGSSASSKLSGFGKW